MARSGVRARAYGPGLSRRTPPRPIVDRQTRSHRAPSPLYVAAVSRFLREGSGFRWGWELGYGFIRRRGLPRSARTLDVDVSPPIDGHVASRLRGTPVARQPSGYSECGDPFERPARPSPAQSHDLLRPSRFAARAERNRPPCPRNASYTAPTPMALPAVFGSNESQLARPEATIPSAARAADRRFHSRPIRSATP